MLKRLAEGTMIGVGIVLVVGVAFAIAWAGDVFTVDKDGTLKFAVSDQGKITVGATESYVNLVIQNNAAAVNNKVDITADVLTVEGIRLENVNVSADITASGAGGLDTGSEAADTWYYVWVVTNNNGTSVNGLLSASSTTPTIPSGFTKKRRVGAVKNSSGNFLQFIQEGNFVAYDDVVSSNRVLTNGVATTWTDVDCSSFLPATSRRAVLRLQLGLTHNTANVVFSGSVRSNGSTAANGHARVSLTTQVVNTFIVQQFVTDCITDANRIIEYIISSVPSVGGSGVVIDVNGYYDRI